MTKKILRCMGLMLTTIIITASVVGAAVYGWHIGELRSLEDSYDDQIKDYKQQISELNSRIKMQESNDFKKVSFVSEEHGFKFDHSSDYTIEMEETEEEGESYIHLDLMDGEEEVFGLSTFDPNLESFITKYMIEGSREDTVIDGKVGYSYKIESMKDGSEISETMVYLDDRLMVFYGEGEKFEEILSTFEFL